MSFCRFAILPLCFLFACGQQNQVPGSAQNSQAPIVAELDSLPQVWYDMQPAEIELGGGEGTSTDTTRNFYFILDGSGSMGQEPDKDCGGDGSFRTKMAGAVWALERFMEQVPEDVNIGLLTFDKHGISEKITLGQGNREAFLKEINDVNVGLGTPLAEAIETGTNRLIKQYKQQLGYGEYRLVVITDGEAKYIPRASIYAARMGIPIYAIGLCVDEKHPLRQFSVSYRAANDFDALASGLQETLAELPTFDVTEFQ